jgi:hypothetical protein
MAASLKVVRFAENEKGEVLTTIHVLPALRESDKAELYWSKKELNEFKCRAKKRAERYCAAVMALIKRLNMAFLPIEERKRDMQAFYAWIAGNRRGLKIRIKSVARSTTRSLPRDVVRYYKVLLVAEDQSNTGEALASFYRARYQFAKSQVFVWLVARCQARAATQACQVNAHRAAIRIHAWRAGPRAPPRLLRQVTPNYDTPSENPLVQSVLGRRTPNQTPSKRKCSYRS